MKKYFTKEQLLKSGFYKDKSGGYKKHHTYQCLKDCRNLPHNHTTIIYAKLNNDNNMYEKFYVRNV